MSAISDHAAFDQALAAAESRPATDGLNALINSRALAQERLPMLEVIGERMLRGLATGLRGLTSDTVDLAFEGMETVRFGDFSDGQPSPVLVAVVHVTPRSGYGLVVVDAPLIQALVDSLLGGAHLEPTLPDPNRRHTTIEISLVARLIRLVLAEFTAAFAPVAPITCELERMESAMRFAAIASPSNIAVVLTIRLAINGRGGLLKLLLPLSNLEPVREKLMQRFVGGSGEGEDSWQSHFERELLRSDADIALILGETALSLTAFSNLAVGSHIAFAGQPDAPLIWRCNDICLGQARAGEHSGRLAMAVISNNGDTV